MRVGVVAVALLSAVSVAVLLPNHPAGRDPAEDTGVFFYAAQRLLEGGAPYRDIWDHKPPGVYFVDAVGLVLGGRVGVWVVQLAFLVAAVFASFLALRREFGDVAAFLGSLAWLVALPRLFLENLQTNFVEFFALPLQFGALLVYRRPLTVPRALAIGVLGGAALLLKPTLIGIWLAMGVALALTRQRSAILASVAIPIGAIVPLLPVAAWAMSRGVFGDMVDQALVYNSAYAAYSPWSERLGAVIEGLRLTLPSGLAIISVVAWAYAVVTRRWSSPLVAIGLAAFPVELVLATFGRGYHYYFIAWLPAMAVLTACGVSELQRRVPARPTRIALVLATLVMCMQPARLVTRLALTIDARASSAAASYVAANSRADDRVFIWGARAEVLYLAERLSPTRYVYQYGPLYTRGYAASSRVAELLGDVERNRPVLILDASLDSPVTPPLDSAGLQAWTSPDAQYIPPPELARVVAFIEANYVRAGTVPETGWPVWKRRTP
jgi:hypothetical protein